MSCGFNQSRNRSPSRLRRLLLCSALALLSAAASRAATFTSTLDRDRIVVGESAVLTLKIEGGQPANGIIPVPRVIPQLQATDQGTSQSYNIVNNQMSSSVARAIALTPTQPGEYTILPVRAEVDGQFILSQQLKLTVLASDPSEPPADYRTNEVFLWLVLPKKEIFEGEPIVAEVRLYVREGIANIVPQIPPLTGNGFNAGNYIPGQIFQRAVGGLRYSIVSYQVPLTPVRDGQLAVGPISGTVVAYFPIQSRNPFDQRTTPKELPVSLEPQTVSVLKLPPETPPDFNGAVGNFTITYSAGPTNLPAGDPITIKVQISGEGRFDTLTLPQQSWDGFKTYPPSMKVETQDPLGLRGTKLFEQIVVPQNENVKQLPPLSFSFFDPAQKKYRTLTGPAVPLLVREGPSAVNPVVAANTRLVPEDPAAGQDLVQIKRRLGPATQIGALLVQQPWFLALQSVPALALLSLTVWRKRNDSLANNPRLRRQRQVAQMIRDGIVDLRKLAMEKKSDEFFAQLFHLLQEQLGERLHLPASAITEAVIDEHLRARRVPETTLASLQELFQTCNLARYARSQTSDELAAVIPKFESVIRELQEVKP